MTEQQAKEIIKESQRLYKSNLQDGKLPPDIVGEISRNQILLVSAGVCTDQEFVEGVRGS